MQLGQSSGGESGERLLVVYLGVGRKSGRMVSMAKWDWVEKLGEWLQSLVECVRRDQCDIVPGGQVVREQIGAVVGLRRGCRQGGPVAWCLVCIGKVCCRLGHL